MYELFYGLNRRPFRMSPDVDCFCPSHSHKRALVHLRYGLQQTEGFVVLTGLPGAGKTLLLTLLISELKKQDIQVANVGNAMMEDTDLLPAILSSFNKPIFEFQLRALISQLEAFLLSKAKLGQRSVIVIDEAQNLSLRSLEILRLLSNLQYKNHSVLQVVLVGDTSLEETISGPENYLLRQRVTLSYQINPMPLEDTKNYILHRLGHAGWNADPKIKEDVFAVIHHISGGLPGKINHFCDRLLMQGMLQKKHVLAGEDVENLLADDDKKFTTPAIEHQSINERKAIEKVSDKVIEAKPIFVEQDSSVVEADDNAVSDVQNIFVNELEKEIEDNDKSQTTDFKTIKNSETNSGAMAALLFSYAASFFIAIALFYVTDNRPAENVITIGNPSETPQVVQRDATSSVAVMD